MAFKQPRVPEYREGENMGKYLKTLVLFLKDFCEDAWVASRNAGKALDKGLSSIKIEYPVTSVNKKTGDVVLGASDVGALGADATAKDAQKLGGKAPKYYTAYTNHADNSDFTHWVAQVGIGGAHGTETYGGDRWILTDGTITGEENADGDGHSNITLNGTLVQVVPSPPAAATPFIEMVSGDAEISYDASVGEIVITSDGGVIKNVLLLDGEWTEKPEYVSKGYATELAECGFYFSVVGTKPGNNVHTLFAQAATTTVINANGYVGKMRLFIPVFSIVGTSYLRQGTTDHSYSIDGGAVHNGILYLNLKLSSGSVTQGSMFALRFANGAYMALSADIPRRTAE